VFLKIGNDGECARDGQKAKNYRLSYLSNLKEEELDNYLEELQSLIATKSE